MMNIRVRNQFEEFGSETSKDDLNVQKLALCTSVSFHVVHILRCFLESKISGDDSNTYRDMFRVKMSG